MMMKSDDTSPGIGSNRAFHMPASSVSYFSQNEENFKGLIDALAVGDLRSAMELGEKSGLSPKAASLMVRDSAALASAVLSIAQEARW